MDGCIGWVAKLNSTTRKKEFRDRDCVRKPLYCEEEALSINS